jgi:hypothetical protein
VKHEFEKSFPCSIRFSSAAKNFSGLSEMAVAESSSVKRLIAISVVVLLVFAIWLENFGGQPVEPVWRGHSLSQWLDAYDTNLRFPDETPPRSGFSDEEIEQALNGIGDRAFPFLLKWLTIKYDYLWRSKVFIFLHRTGLSRFFHDVPEATDWPGRASRGFEFYGTNAQPLLPALEKLTHSSNEDIRLYAYGAAFSTFPPKEIFLPLADRVFKEEKLENQGFAAQWMIQRFPEEADKRGLRSRYPQFFGDSIATNKTN